ncbi:hypothetical protein PC116_g2567 [Phytophthora cactorum]|uniref:Uncharacterized protein n=1 Tax=Phytophthora cactorum TaxID=29920 RepID=A0A8T0ZXK5_9STRA|nr:hypothetical protein PC113_g2404 [Phytophthora cactorum]KAG2953603.1 hypothetical protein PC117_g1847 [Phytophthora cactorum]KAG4249791.1 hypothetical protein PC116_g2567 [Phytophthora cactorum]
MHQTADPVLCPVLALRHIMQARRELRQQSSTYLMVDLPAGEMAKELKDTAERISTRKLEISWQEVKLAAPEVFFK